ncbi:Mutator mutT protein (7,8-dihydro-8-oxoguanine-triphosphatase) [Clostridiaceae bacterium JG1575]|nr:Mutator mutT protein (7,8-dihydro-8-oxoguanine-triphosphatase) [Clostridiaceae bacterium JG1575]
MKTIRVAAAVFWRPGAVFATRRAQGEWAGFWEFPGGKIEAGETSPGALVREIQEELGVLIDPGAFFATVTYDYPEFHLFMETFLCPAPKEPFVLLEHAEGRWVPLMDLTKLQWLPADRPLVKKIQAELF